ncbi:hypothetical protein C8N24_0302 [Solirubrobacter pauli]|uniref:TrbL/VirB6 plasmid conjugal transfer protein n=1 Tax=Solirubrobacter pauli TaxID=166793 RepID=A0A660L676_9ACTN|nr:hypothetical protein [Solirubrobacter pauli]RKQ90497.1 hypothetical protein C8N24_0302 [Solirubrobacter pauli]
MTRAQLTRCALLVSAFAVAGLVGPAAALAATPSAPPPVFGLFGVDISDLVGDVVKGVFDVLVPDFASKWATQLVAWMVAVPDVSNTKTFPELNAFQQQLLAVGFGLVGIGFVAAALQYLAAGITGRMNAVDAFQRSAVACGMLVFYPKLMGLATVGTNLLTDAIVTAPRITKGIDTMLGAAFVLAVATGGFSVGMAVGAAAACLWFLAGIFVMKIAITAAMAILLLSGGIVLGLHAFAPLSWLPRLWSSVLVAVHAIPIAWALIFAAAALLTSDSLIFNQGLGASLEAAVKPFVAVACLYLAYKAPAFLLAAARTMGVNMTGLAPAMGGGRGGGGGGGGGRIPGVGAAAGAGGPGGNVARRALQTHGDRMRGLRAAIGARSAAPAARVRQAVSQSASSATSAAKRAAAPVAVNAAAALGPADGSARARALSTASNGAKKTGTAVRGAAQGAATGARAVRSANDWWRTQLPQKGAQLRNGIPGTPATSASRQGDGAAAAPGSSDASASARRPASREKTSDVTRTANGNGSRDGAPRTQAPAARTPRTPSGAGAGARPAVPTGPSGSKPANGKAATAPSTSAPGPVVSAGSASGAANNASAARAKPSGVAAAATKAAADKPGKPKPPPAAQTTSDRPTPRPPRSN